MAAQNTNLSFLQDKTKLVYAKKDKFPTCQAKQQLSSFSPLKGHSNYLDHFFYLFTPPDNPSLLCDQAATVAFQFPKVIGVGYGLNANYLPCFKLLVKKDVCRDEPECDRLKTSVAEGIIRNKTGIDTKRCKEFIEVGEMIDLPSYEELAHGGKKFSFKGSDDEAHTGTITCLLNAEVKITMPGDEAPITHKQHYAMTCAHCILPTNPKTKSFCDFCIKTKLAIESTQPLFDRAWTQYNEQNRLNLLSHYKSSERSPFDPECLFRANYPWVQRQASDLVEDYVYQYPPLDSEGRPVRAELLMTYLCSRFGVYPANSEVPRMCLNYGTESSFRDDYSTCYTLDVGVLKLDSQGDLQACCCQQSIPDNIEIPLDPEVHVPLDLEIPQDPEKISMPKDQTMKKVQNDIKLNEVSAMIEEQIMETTKIKKQKQKNSQEYHKNVENIVDMKKDTEKSITELKQLLDKKDTEKSITELKQLLDKKDTEKSELKRLELDEISSSETEDEKHSLKSASSDEFLPHMAQYALSDGQDVQPLIQNEFYEEIPMTSMRKIWSSCIDSNITLKLALVTEGDEVRTRKLDNKEFYFELIVRHRSEQKHVKLPVIIFNGRNIRESSGGLKFIEDGVSGSPLFLIRDDTPTFYFLGNVCGEHAASRCDVAIRSVAPQIYRNLMESMKKTGVRPDILTTITSLKTWFQEHYLDSENEPIENVTINPCLFTIDWKRQKGHEVMLASHNEQRDTIQVRLNVRPCFKNCGSRLLHHI